MSDQSQRHPNVILIITDQQRFDTLQAGESGYAHTPTIDRLAREGASFTQCHAAAPSCVPSRASFFQGEYPHVTGVLSNHFRWNHSWVEAFRNAGFHTVNIGKMHTNPFDAPCGFDERFVVENKDRKMRLFRPHGSFYDEWDKLLLNAGKRKPSRETYSKEHPDYPDALGAFEWPLEEQFHPDYFVAHMAEWFINKREAESPLFLQIGFPGPHPPYDPPRRFIERYEQREMPIPRVTQAEIKVQPPPHHRYRQEMIQADHDSIRWKENPSEAELQRLWKHYAANMTLIDEGVEKILKALENRGYLENSIVLFTSDHGEFLGEHGLIEKWLMYDCITRVPMVVWSPGRIPAGAKVNDLIQHFDIVPSLFAFAGVESPLRGSAISALEVLSGERKGREVVFAEQGPDPRVEGVQYQTMVRTQDWKLVHYFDQAWGELYDLKNDPGETKNLWNESSSERAKQELLDRLREWRIRSTTINTERNIHIP